MQGYDLDESVGHWIRMAAHTFEQAMNKEFAPQAVTWRQFQVLSLLAGHGQLAQVDLAERLNMDPATLVGVLDRMERDGLIVRTDCPHDRRRKLIAPLPKAEAVWKQIIQCEQRIRARAGKGLTAEQLETLHKLLELVQANLTRDDKPAASRKSLAGRS